MIDVFISHSSRDSGIAEALIDLLRSALNLSSNRIRCTSVNGHRLPVGATTDDQLRREVHEAIVFIGLITPTSLQSAYVLFELGARWGAGLHLAPVLASGADTTVLKGPLSTLNALSCDIPSQVFQLVGDIASTLQIDLGNPSAYHKYVDALVQESKQVGGNQTPNMGVGGEMRHFPEPYQPVLPAKPTVQHLINPDGTLTPEAIIDAIRSAPLLQQSEIVKRYIGQILSCQGVIIGAGESPGNSTNLIISTGQVRFC